MPLILSKMLLTISVFLAIAALSVGTEPMWESVASLEALIGCSEFYEAIVRLEAHQDLLNLAPIVKHDEGAVYSSRAGDLDPRP
jgi:hypothetical protein